MNKDPNSDFFGFSLELELVLRSEREPEIELCLGREDGGVLLCELKFRFAPRPALVSGEEGEVALDWDFDL